jgi:hypothetical protein
MQQILTKMMAKMPMMKTKPISTFPKKEKAVRRPITFTTNKGRHPLRQPQQYHLSALPQL